jgi:hypothetical protein
VELALETVRTVGAGIAHSGGICRVSNLLSWHISPSHIKVPQKTEGAKSDKFE